MGREGKMKERKKEKEEREGRNSLWAVCITTLHTPTSPVHTSHRLIQGRLHTHEAVLRFSRSCSDGDGFTWMSSVSQHSPLLLQRAVNASFMSWKHSDIKHQHVIMSPRVNNIRAVHTLKWWSLSYNWVPATHTHTREFI